jgi:hypothetical protein
MLVRWKGRLISEAELRVALAVRSFLAGRPGQWWAEHALFPDRRAWSHGRNRLSWLCRLHLQRLRARKLLEAFGIEARAERGCWALRKPRSQTNPGGPGNPCALDLLLGEQARRVR